MENIFIKFTYSLRFSGSPYWNGTYINSYACVLHKNFLCVLMASSSQQEPTIYLVKNNFSRPRASRTSKHQTLLRMDDDGRRWSDSRTENYVRVCVYFYIFSLLFDEQYFREYICAYVRVYTHLLCICITI